MSRPTASPALWGEYQRLVTLFIDPANGEMRIDEEKHKDVFKLHFDLRDKPYQTNRTLGVLSKMFSLAEVLGPAAGRVQFLPSTQALQGEQA